MTLFRTAQLDRLAESGWVTCPSVAGLVSERGLPLPTAGYLAQAFGADLWRAAESMAGALRAKFAGARFADTVEWGVLLVPDPARLDTRAPAPPEARRYQLGTAAEDVVDPRLTEGVLGIRSRRPWTPVVTAVGAYGVALGSFREVAGAAVADFKIRGVDTRRLMIRQLWGARVLQCGARPPDCEANERWTFTLLPGEGLTDGCAESGTVLKGRVRFRLGKPDRGIGSARVAPAIALRP